MPSFRAPRGTYDILPDDQPYWSFALDAAAKTAARFGYGRIDTPLFEPTDLFERGVGDATDIVQKEMYTFEDHGGDSLTLRPEGRPASAGPTSSTACTTSHSRCGCTIRGLTSDTNAPRLDVSGSYVSLVSRRSETVRQMWTLR